MFILITFPLPFCTVWLIRLSIIFTDEKSVPSLPGIPSFPGVPGLPSRPSAPCKHQNFMFSAIEGLWYCSIRMYFLLFGHPDQFERRGRLCLVEDKYITFKMGTESRRSYMRLLTLCPAGPGGPLRREDKSSLVPPDITSLFSTSPWSFPHLQTYRSKTQS